MAEKKVILITGANSGLGLEIVKALCKQETPYSILVGSRNVQNGEAAIENVKKEIPNTTSTLAIVQVDVESDDSIEKAFETVSSKYGKLDVLVNNAGAGFDRDIAQGKYSIREGFNKSWDVNVAGAQVMTTTFVPLLLKSSDPRLIFVTSGTASMAETEKKDTATLARLNASLPAGWPKDLGINPIISYRSTKTGLNMMMREWHRILLNDGVKVWCVSPGFLATGLTGIGPEQLKKVPVDSCAISVQVEAN